jgi:hypothetical protein
MRQPPPPCMIEIMRSAILFNPVYRALSRVSGGGEEERCEPDERRDVERHQDVRVPRGMTKKVRQTVRID